MGDPLSLAPAVVGVGFPWWVVRKVGYPVLLEANFSDTYPNTKFGTLLGGTSTVSSDTANLKWGGSGSAKMLTSTTSGQGAEIKATVAPLCLPGDLLAFEQKWAQGFAQGSTEFQMGLEARTSATIYQARFSWTNTNAKWQYESAADTYSDFSGLATTKATQYLYGDTGANQPSATIGNSAVNTSAGTPVQWARVVIDPYNRNHYSFECGFTDSSGNGYARVWDMRGLALISNGSASRALYLPFTYVITHSTAAEPGYTTDWCLSVIPKGSPGGSLGSLDTQVVI